jgi:glucose 1-dehydrogenase
MMQTNRVAIVTGGDSGIGHAICLALASSGTAVTVNYHHNQDAAQNTLQQIQQGGGRGQIVQGDVSVLDDIQTVIDETVKASGRLDVMVNNAGMEARKGILDTTEHDYDLVMGVDAKSAFFGCQLAAKEMIKEGHGGRIINISSVHEDWPMPGNITYCCAKGAIRMLARTAGVELAHHDITVVNVGPGAVNTPIDAKTMANPQEKERLDTAIPMGRVAQPSEIAKLVAWLGSEDASYGTATTYVIDGGLMQASVGL